MFADHPTILENAASRHFFYCFKAIKNDSLTAKILIDGFDIQNGMPNNIRITSSTYDVPGCKIESFGYESSDCAILLEFESSEHKRGKFAYIIPNPFQYHTDGLMIGIYLNDKKKPTQFHLSDSFPFHQLSFDALWPKPFQKMNDSSIQSKLKRLYQTATIQAFESYSSIDHQFHHPHSNAYFGTNRVSSDIKLALKGDSYFQKMLNERISVTS